MQNPAADLLLRLEQALEPADRAAFKVEAEAALAALPMRGPGADYRACAVVWRRHFHPPAAMVVIDASARYVNPGTRARAFDGIGGPE